jgi:hypothetical protein
LRTTQPLGRYIGKAIPEIQPGWMARSFSVSRICEQNIVIHLCRHPNDLDSGLFQEIRHDTLGGGIVVKILSQ